MKLIKLIFLLVIVGCSTDSGDLDESSLQGEWVISKVETTQREDLSEEKPLTDTIRFLTEDQTYLLDLSQCGSYQLKYNITGNRIIFNSENSDVGTWMNKCPRNFNNSLLAYHNSRIWNTFIRTNGPVESSYVWPSDSTYYSFEGNELTIESTHNYKLTFTLRQLEN